MIWTILFNLLGIAVLGAVLYYAWRLDRRLRALDKNRYEMEKFLGDFSTAIARAERAIRDLQDTAEDSGVEVERNISRAAGLRDELNFLIDAADKIATRLTNNTSQAQTDARKAAPEKKEPPQEEAKAAVKPAPMPVETAPVEAPAARSTLKLPAWLKPVRSEAVAQEISPAVQEDAPPEAKKIREPGRSQAERELQQALEKMR